MADPRFLATPAWLRRYLDEQCGVDLDTLVLEQPLVGQANLDSLDLVELQLNADDEFGLQIPEDALTVATTVQQVIAVIDAHRGLNKPQGNPLDDSGTGEAVLGVCLLAMCALGGALGLALGGW